MPVKDQIQLDEQKSWIFFGHRVPRSQIVFCIQTVLVFFLAIVSVVSLMRSTACEETTVWVAILSSSVGYMLPSPRP